jgi:hypothetical protein
MVDLILRVNPSSILDIGIGFGKYGFLSREYLDIAQGNYHKFKVRIDGIEGFKDYLTPIHKTVYDKIYLGNALEVLPKIYKKYDLVLLIDCLEHFDQAEGQKLLKLISARARSVIVSVPSFWVPQGASFNNDLEEHKYFWRRKDFKNFKHKTFFEGPESLIVYFGEENRNLKRRARTFVFDNLLSLCRYRLQRVLKPVKN